MRPKLKLITLKCCNCSKEFQKYPSQVKAKKDTAFCQNQCVIDYRKIHWQGKIDAICKTCGKEFKFNRAELKKSKGAGSFCSRTCQANGHEIRECLICKKEFKVYLSDIKRGNKRFCSVKCYNLRTNIIEKFFENISYRNPNGCWNWIGRTDSDGYGIIAIRQNVRAHRFSYEFHNKIDTGEMLICHKCDNPPCVNPEHLYAGTFKDNALDRIDKTRHKF